MSTFARNVIHGMAESQTVGLDTAPVIYFIERHATPMSCGLSLSPLPKAVSALLPRP